MSAFRRLQTGTVALTAGVLALALVPTAARAVDCVDYRDILAGPLFEYDQGVQVNAAVPYGDFVLVVENSGGLQIVSWSSVPAAPRGWQNLAAVAQTACVVGPVAFVAAYEGGLEVVDISDVDAPAFLGRAWVPARALDVVSIGDHLLVADHEFGFEVLDITNPAEPWFVESMAGFVAVDLELRGDVLFIADDENLSSPIFDVSDPTLPVEVGTLPAGYSHALTTWGDYVYSARKDNWSASSTVEVLWAGDPSSARLVGTIEVTKPYRLVAHDGFLYVGTLTGEVAVFSLLSGPANPVHFADIPVGGSVTSIAGSERGVLVTTSSGMVLALAPQCRVGLAPGGEGAAPEDHARPLTIAPNPFVTGTQIRFPTPGRGSVRVAVFDLAGRRVRQLGAPSAGTGGVSRVSWDGRDEAGSRVAAGVYFVRLEGPGVRATERVTLRR